MPKCRLCNDFQRSARQFRLAFDCSQQALIQSANGGCVICSILLEGFRHFEAKLEVSQDNDRIYVWGGDVDGGGAVEMEVFSDGALRIRLEFFNTKGKTSILQGARMLPIVPGDTRAPASIGWAKQRLQECVDSHASCGQESIPELPNRVLDLRSGADDMMNIKLIRTQGLDARYACLSHRWSKPAALTTVKSNYVSHTKGIGWDVFPKTFIDAITIAQDLGLRYLWIDSLCIIQDDEDDKLHEIAKMSSVYTNSYITIAATHSESSMHGCYSTGSLHHQDYQISSSKQHSAVAMETDLYVREKIAHIGEERAMTPLLKRGWVCQERLLSPRVLHYCEKELVWECRESSSCQCSCFNPPIHHKQKYMEVFRRGVSIDDYNARIVGMSSFSLWSTAHLDPCDDKDGRGTLVIPPAWSLWFKGVVDASNLDPYVEPRMTLREWMHRHNFRNTSNAVTSALRSSLEYYQKGWNWTRLLQFRPKRKTDEPINEPGSGLPRLRFDSRLEYVFPRKLNDEVIRRWRYIISDYTGMDLTERRDRLPAIAGVASQFESLLGGRYLSGLWESALPGDLLWRVDQSGQHTPQYRAPSWSWASIEGKIKYYKMTSYHPEFSIVRALCDPLSKINPFGEVASGLLEINVIAANLTFWLDLSKDEASPRRPIKVEFMGDTAIFIPDCDLTVRATPLHIRGHGTQFRQYEFLCIGDFNIECNDATISETRSGPEASLAASLVIHKVNEDRYERVGILERHRVHYPKSLEDVSRFRNYEGYLRGLYQELHKSGKKNSQTMQAWKFIPGLVLI
ncbi:unnamed protein product [Alternaria alternata]